MAHQHKNKVDIQKLIERSEKARDTITEARLELKNKFDIAGRVRETLTSDPAKLVGGSVVGGYFLKKLFFRKKRREHPSYYNNQEVSHLKKERGFLLGAIAMIVALAKPVAKMYATKLLKDYLQRRLRGGTMERQTVSKISRY